MTIDTFVENFARAAASNLTDSSFPSKIPTTTEPTGGGVLALGTPGAASGARNNLLIVPIGTGADNATVQMRVIGWRLYNGGTLWIPVVLAQVTCTLCAAVGVASGDVLSTERFCDTIALDSGYGNANVDNAIVSPTGDLIGHFLVDAKGFRKVEVTVDLGTATAANALVAGL